MKKQQENEGVALRSAGPTLQVLADDGSGLSAHVPNAKYVGSILFRDYSGMLTLHIGENGAVWLRSWCNCDLKEEWHQWCWMRKEAHEVVSYLEGRIDLKTLEETAIEFVHTTTTKGEETLSIDQPQCFPPGCGALPGMFHERYDSEEEIDAMMAALGIERAAESGSVAQRRTGAKRTPAKPGGTSPQRPKAKK